MDVNEPADNVDKGLEGGTALHIAVSRGHVNTIRLLKDLGADMNLFMERSKNRGSPLHYAAGMRNGDSTDITLLAFLYRC